MKDFFLSYNCRLRNTRHKLEHCITKGEIEKTSRISRPASITNLGITKKINNEVWDARPTQYIALTKAYCAVPMEATSVASFKL